MFSVHNELLCTYMKDGHSVTLQSLSGTGLVFFFSLILAPSPCSQHSCVVCSLSAFNRLPSVFYAMGLSQLPVAPGDFYRDYYAWGMPVSKRSLPQETLVTNSVPAKEDVDIYHEQILLLSDL